MGKKIDRIIGRLCLIAGVFIICLRAFESIPVSCVAAFLICAALRRIMGKTARKPKMSVRDAQKILNSWAYGPESDAICEISKLTSLDADRSHAAFVLRPLGFTLSKSDVFAQWKRHTGQDRLTIVATCYSDGQARVFSESLNSPSVQLIDASKLIPMIRRSALQPPQRKPFADTFRQLKIAFASLPARHSWRKNALFGMLLMLLYLITGNSTYLLLSISALYLAGAALRLRRR